MTMVDSGFARDFVEGRILLLGQMRSIQFKLTQSQVYIYDRLCLRSQEIYLRKKLRNSCVTQVPEPPPPPTKSTVPVPPPPPPPPGSSNIPVPPPPPPGSVKNPGVQNGDKSSECSEKRVTNCA